MDSVSVNKSKAGTVNTNSKSVKKNIKPGKSVATSSGNSKNEFSKRKKFSRKGRGVVYLNHIPHGFYEDQMRSYFNQFGKVRATSVARSKKTGRSKGYGFVEFDDEEVAKIAAETMNNYLMYNRVIKCRYIPPEERKGKIFLTSPITGDYPRKKNRMNNLKSKMKALSNFNQSTYTQKTIKKINEFKKFFNEKGIDFKFKFSLENPEVSNLNSETMDGVNDQYGVLEIDESDQEISFKTPPKVKKIIKKSSLKNFSHDNAQTGKKIKSEIPKTLNLKNTKKIKNIKKNNKNTDIDFQKISQKGKRESKKLKGKEKLLVKSTEIKKLRPSKKDISAALKQKNAKILRSNDLGLQKKGKITKQPSQFSDRKVSKKMKIEIMV